MEIVKKKLSANDVGATGTKQYGILIPKVEATSGLFPSLDPALKNPDIELICLDENDQKHEFRFVYYNNKLHDLGGTRNEYRVTLITTYLEKVGAREGDFIEFSKAADHYRVRLLRGIEAGLDLEQSETPESEEQDFVKYQITNYPADMTISGYLEKHKNEQLIIPEFQRNYVWDQVKASKLIESFLLGLPVPGVFLYKDRKSNKLLIIDGQQRITSAINYMKGVFGGKIFRLKGVHSRWEDKAYEELNEADKLQISDTVLRATIIQQLDPHDDSSIYYIFERLNTGGMNLNPMEVRRCVYYGDFIRRLELLNLYPAWRKIIGTDQPDKRMRDVELALRCIALVDSWKEYEKPMKGFLNDFLLRVKNVERTAVAELLDGMEQMFKTTCDRIVEGLGEKPFNVYGPLNFALLDSIFVGVAESEIGADLNERYLELLATEEYEHMCRVSTSDEKNVSGRINLALNVFSR